MFSRIDELKQEAEQENSKLEFLVKTSYLEIYNEQILDLLDPNKFNLLLREDIKKGVYVEGLTEDTITSTSEMYELIRRGTLNRHVGCTSMNKESS